MRRVLRLPALALCLASLAFRLAAQDSTAADPRAVQPERPTVATHAHTVAPGYAEVETGIEGDHAAGGRAYFAPTVAKFGVTSHVQLDLFIPAVFAGAGRASGIGDVALGVKWRLLDHHALLGDFALLPTVKFPTGSPRRGTGSGTTDVGIIAIASYDIRGISMDLNVGYTRVGAQGAHPASGAALWTASFGVPVVGRFGWNVEFFGYPSLDRSGEPSTVAFLTGPGFLVNRILNLDCGFVTPLSGRQPNAIYAGAVWNIGRLAR